MRDEGGTPISIEPAGTLTAGLFRREYHGRSRPVLVRGHAADWPARRRWNFDFFAREYGSIRVTIRRSFAETDELRTTIGEYLAGITRNPEPNSYYVANGDFCRECPELRADYEPPAFLPNWFDELPADVFPGFRWILIGPAGSGSRMHVDVFGTASWNVVLLGEKLWCFHPPGELAGESPQTMYCVQRAGDLVYIPSGWWHAVENLDASICVTENLVDEANVRVVAEEFDGAGLRGWRDFLKSRAAVARVDETGQP